MNNKSPILFLIFNRPLETQKVFESIKEAQPSQLFIAADGPRLSYPQEKALSEEVRKIVTHVDWPCEVKTRFQDENLGCRMHVSSSIDWFFEHVEEGIILEDDCLPHSSFFSFADTLLEKYRGNEKVMHISGTNFQFGHHRGEPSSSYYFSRCPHIWGWATWKRAWRAYDVDMPDLESFVGSKKIYSLFKSKRVADFWISLFQHIKKKKVDTWDAQWAYTVMKSDGFAITPNVNLVENIGFGITSTHTGNSNDKMRQSAHKIGTITHSTKIAADEEADDFLAKILYIESFWSKLFRRLKIR